jgi:restriction system protein
MILILQCKLWNAPVGNKAVQEIAAAKSHYFAKGAAVVSNQSYTPSARVLAKSNGVLLLHHTDLVKLSTIDCIC